MDNSNTLADRNLDGSLDDDLDGSFNRTSRRRSGRRVSTASPRRAAILSASAAVGLAGGVFFSSVATAGLPAAGTDLTSVMLALGLITLGAGSVIAFATRRREESSIL